ncbi:unnamed protein product [Staurois parvus]|uniref:Uncharacterized protein n=1 Tax=Staurois parvus TaxID=386267 RepID=A0ABN9BL01_9NEOB|nr:unnamed protein product [Staurois parvus]
MMDNQPPSHHRMDPVMGTHQRDVPILCIPGIPHRKVKEEIKEEEDEDGGVEESELLKEHKDLYQDTMVESSSYRNPPERCPRPLYSRDSTQEGHTIPHHHQGEDLIDIKVEVKAEEEEAYVRDDQQSMEEDGITGTFIEEDTPTEISTVHGREMRKTLRGLSHFVSRLESRR